MEAFERILVIMFRQLGARRTSFFGNGQSLLVVGSDTESPHLLVFESTVVHEFDESPLLPVVVVKSTVSGGFGVSSTRAGRTSWLNETAINRTSVEKTCIAVEPIDASNQKMVARKAIIPFLFLGENTDIYNVVAKPAGIQRGHSKPEYLLSRSAVA